MGYTRSCTVLWRLEEEFHRQKREEALRSVTFCPDQWRNHRRVSPAPRQKQHRWITDGCCGRREAERKRKEEARKKQEEIRKKREDPYDPMASLSFCLSPLQAVLPLPVAESRRSRRSRRNWQSSESRTFTLVTCSYTVVIGSATAGISFGRFQIS